MGSTPSKEFPKRFVELQRSVQANKSPFVFTTDVRGARSAEALVLTRYAENVQRGKFETHIVEYDISDSCTFNFIHVEKTSEPKCDNCGSSVEK